MTAPAPTASASALPRWDLSNVYAGLDAPEFARDAADLAAQLDALDAYMAEHALTRSAVLASTLAPGAATGPVVSGWLERMNAALRLGLTLEAYVRSFVTTDSYNAEARRWLSRLEALAVQRRQQLVRFEGWLGQQAAALPQVLASGGAAAEHAFFLQETVETSRYLMSEAEEALAAELSLSGDMAWSKLQGTVVSQVVVPFERNGQVENLPMTALLNLSRDPDPDVRRRAYEAEIAAWQTWREPLVAALNGVKGYRVTLNRRQGRPNALHTALEQARLDPAALDAMLAAMRAAFPDFRRYLRAKARRLGHPGGLPWWDLYAPVAPAGAKGGQAERTFDWPETRAFVVEQFATFSPDLAGLAERAFDHAWIDAEPRAGKRAGAFCMGLPAVRESRVLLNFDGTLDEVFTVAHELGHAYHNACLAEAGKLPLQRLTPMTLAETASTLCETLVTDAALRSAASPAEELSILETYLLGTTQIIVDITSRFLFEQEVFARREKAELSGDDLCEIMLRCQAETYGDGLQAEHRHPYMWTWKPHYYQASLSFYNFPYAFGLLFGTGLYALFRERGSAFVADYRALLASTGEATPADLAARFGIDIRGRAFWEASLDVIRQRIDRYQAL